MAGERRLSEEVAVQRSAGRAAERGLATEAATTREGLAQPGTVTGLAPAAVAALAAGRPSDDDAVTDFDLGDSGTDRGDEPGTLVPQDTW
jgi:hypothetical protein